MELDSKRSTAWLGRGLAFRRLDRLEESSKCLEESLRLSKEGSLLNPYERGLAFLNLGNYEEAIGCYDEAIRIDPRNAWAWYGKGIALHAASRFEEAIPSYDMALELKTDLDPARQAKNEAMGKKKPNLKSLGGWILSGVKHVAGSPLSDYISMGQSVLDLVRKLKELR